MKDLKQKALDFLESNATIKEIYATTDGFLFTKKADATTHAQALNEGEPIVETFYATEPETAPKKLSIAELKALKENTIQEYTALFEDAPDAKLSAKELQKLIDAEKLKRNA
jgi:hypothetical protein